MDRKVAYASLAALALLAGSVAVAGGDWNDEGVAWMGFDEGLAAAAENGKPVCLIFFTDWCPHCVNYAKMFHDDRVVERSREFVMIRLNKEAHPKLSARFAPDGQYIPRTYFLASDGKLDVTLDAQRDKYRYFYSESRAESILEGMARALKKLTPAEIAKD